MRQALDLTTLTELPRAALEEHFRVLFRRPASAYMHRDILVRAVAHRLQEEADGGPRRALYQRLAQLARNLDRPRGKPIPMAVKAGTRLIREWRGQTYTVSVTESGFLYAGRSYKSLSAIARVITGSRWSGPIFFGLRKSA